GSFGTAGGVEADSIARWDGDAWHALGTGTDNFRVDALTVYDGQLIAGGAFTGMSGVVANRSAQWDGEEWAALGGPHSVGVVGSDLGSSVLGLAGFGDDGGVVANQLVAVGSFLATGGVTNWKVGLYGPDHDDPDDPWPGDYQMLTASD